MGSFLAYTIYSSIFLLFLCLGYQLFLSKEKQIVINRAVLLGCYAVSMTVWPLSRLHWPWTDTEVGLSEPMSIVGNLPLEALLPEDNAPSLWPQILMWIYIAGAVSVLLHTLFSIGRLAVRLKEGTVFRKDGYRIVVMPGAETAPFIIGQCVVMSEVDYATVRDVVTAHELAHIRCRHYLDLVLAQAVCIVLWYNPAAWLMRDKLKLLHEYQADAEVLDGGSEEKEYQMLLIRKTAGNRFHVLVNNLNHSKLKNRITMMQKEKCSGRRRLRLFSLALAVDVAIGIVNIPAVASGLDTLESASLDMKNETKENTSVSSVKPADFPGGTKKLMEYLAMNIRYPEKAQSDNSQGQLVVGFTVAPDGSLTDIHILKSAGKILDEEALRIVRKMPKWTPSISSGKPVASEVALPVRFRLKSIEEKGDESNGEYTNGNIRLLDEVLVVAYGTGPA